MTPGEKKLTVVTAAVGFQCLRRLSQNTSGLYVPRFTPHAQHFPSSYPSCMLIRSSSPSAGQVAAVPSPTPWQTLPPVCHQLCARRLDSVVQPTAAVEAQTHAREETQHT